MQHQVQQVVAPGTQAMQGVVEAEGEGAEWAEGLVAAAVSEQRAPEVVVQDVGPRGLGMKILVGLDGSTAKSRENTSTLIFMRHSRPQCETEDTDMWSLFLSHTDR